MALLPGNTPKRSRFWLVDIMPKGTKGGGNEPTKIGSGTDVPFKVYVPTTQTANAIEVRTPTEGLIWAVSASGGVTEGTPLLIAATGVVVNPHVSAKYLITSPGIAASTLAAPANPADNGLTISITSTTAFAHTLTATGLLQTGSAAANVATFAAFAGAGLTLQAYGGKWLVRSQVGITFT